MVPNYFQYILFRPYLLFPDPSSKPLCSISFSSLSSSTIYLKVFLYFINSFIPSFRIEHGAQITTAVGEDEEEEEEEDERKTHAT